MSEQINNGGPAFPRPCFDNGQTWNDDQKGMTLRDYFAIKATDRDVEDFMHLQGNGAKMQVRGRVAARWAFADAMLAARGDA